MELANTNNTLRAAALVLEREAAELARLAGLGVDFSWLDPASAATSSAALITTGVNLLAGQSHWRPLIQARMKAGLGTLIIPAFKPGDYSAVIGAPTALEAVPAQAQSLNWETQQFRVPASVAFRTKLHASKWATLDGVGALLLSYRPTNTRGCVVFCGASVGSRRPGTDSSDQFRLVQLLFSLAAPTRTENESRTTPDSVDASPLTATEFLAAFPEIGPHALLLLLAGWNPQQPEKLSGLSRSLLGFEPGTEFQAAAARIKSMPAEIESALHHAGWSPFVRKLQERLHEPEEELHA